MPFVLTKVHQSDKMGLLTIIRKNRMKEKEMRFLMLLSSTENALQRKLTTNLLSGLDNAGKTTVLRRINGEDISQIAVSS